MWCIVLWRHLWRYCINANIKTWYPRSPISWRLHWYLHLLSPIIVYIHMDECAPRIYTFNVSRAFAAVAASQEGDAVSSRAPGLTSGLQGSVNVHRSALVLVPQGQCISYFAFYIFNFYIKYSNWIRFQCDEDCKKNYASMARTPKRKVEKVPRDVRSE